MAALNIVFEQSVEKNVQAYAIFFEIENTLRELVLLNLESEYGHKWLKQAIPLDVREKIGRGIKYERSIPWQKLVLHNPLYYIDFPDLKKIMISGLNWTALFGDIFQNKSGTDSSLSDIESVRNKIAHNRLVSDADMAVLRGVWTKIIGSIPPLDVERAQNRIGVNRSVLSQIRDMRNWIEESLVSIEAGASLSASSQERFDSVEKWWFDSIYLGICVRRIEIFVGQCQLYSFIPSGIGQAIKRRSWAEENKMMENGSNALFDVVSMISAMDVDDA